MRNPIKNKIIALLLLSVILTVFGSVAIVYAQPQQYTPLAPLPGITPSTPTNIGTYANAMVKILIGIAAVLAIIMIMVGGLQYMSTDAISGKTEGKERITQALFGLGLAIASWLILTTISPTLLKVDLTVTSYTAPSSGNKRCAPTLEACREQTAQSINNLVNQRNCTIQSRSDCAQEGTQYCFMLNYTCPQGTTVAP